MTRLFAYAFVAAMLVAVIGQEFRLARSESRPVTEITLYESRLVPFLNEIRASNPATYDSILTNLGRIRTARRGPDRYTPEETVVAEMLLERLMPLRGSWRIARKRLSLRPLAARRPSPPGAVRKSR